MTFCLSTEPGIFPIVSLHCNALFGPESWLGAIYYKQGCFRSRFGWKNADCDSLQEVDTWIQTFQLSVSEGKLRPTDELCSLFPFDRDSATHLSLLDVRFPRLRWYEYFLTHLYQLPFGYYGSFEPGCFPAICKYIKYMLHHNVTTNYRSSVSAFRKLCKSFVWTEEVHHLASYIIERCGPINWAPQHWIEKRNMQSLLCRNEDCENQT